MTAYLIDEDVLKQVLDALENVYVEWDEMIVTPQELAAIKTLRAILSAPPSEPVAWYDAKLNLAYIGKDLEDDIPLYRKDTP